MRMARVGKRPPGKVQQQKIRAQLAGEIEEQLRQLLLLREQQRREDSLLRRILTL